MVDQRVRRLFAARDTAQGDDLFGEYELVKSGEPAYRSPVKRVAVLTEAFLPKVDGVSKTTYLTIRYLQQTGREVLVFAPDIAVPRVGPSEVVALPSISVPRAPETRMALPHPLIMRRLEAFKPDLIHLASPALMTVSGMAAGHQLGVPVVANYQTDLPGYAVHYGTPMLSAPIRNWLRYLHNGCHINLVPTYRVQNELHHAGFRRLRIWGRGVNIERFNPSNATLSMRERLLNGRDSTNVLMIYVGRLANEKRVDDLIEVARIPGVALTIIGDGAMREPLETLFAGTDTFFTGYMVGEELSEAFASADAFIFPGPNETFGQVIQEAMASGLPVIVTEQGAASDHIQEGVTGFICDHNPAAFAEAARRLVENPTLRLQMGHAARAYAEMRPWSSIMSQLENHYQEALTRNTRFSRLFGPSFYANHFAIGARLTRLRRDTFSIKSA